MTYMKALFVLLLLASGSYSAIGQELIAYGNNPKAGQFFEVNGTRLYYEVYGEGPPLLMLHGGVYGYIDEFEPFLPVLSKQFQVICLATRGHGKSEIGHEPFTFEQRANDAYQLIRHLQLDSVRVIGFSDGAATALKLAALYPEPILKVVAMGIGDKPAGSRKDQFQYTAESLLAANRTYFESRLKLMPEPERWHECLQMLNHLYNEDFLSTETFSRIQCPVLLMNGDADDYYPVDALVKIFHNIAQAQLSIIPGCRHVIFYCKFPAVWEAMRGFLGE